MNVCTTCRKQYSDITFCPEDGSRLVPFVPSSGGSHSAPTEMGMPARVAQPTPNSSPGSGYQQTVGHSTGPGARLVVQPPPADAGPEAWIGQVMGNYSLTRLLGVGGMGAVYLAQHNVLPKKAAVKLLKRELAVLPEVAVRFQQEAKAAADISHENVVQIFDFGAREDGTVYLVMEFLEGRSLSALLKEGALTVPRVHEILRQICWGLSIAHERGIVHRDLKPDNIFLATQRTPEGGTREVVKILDFGIAKITNSLHRANGPQTGTGMILGTPHYMSPEQAEGGKIDLRSDIYSLGIILYEMLAGKIPFTGDTFGKILLKHIGEDPVPLRQVRPELKIPPSIDRVVLQCLAKKPEDRPKDTKELLTLWESAMPNKGASVSPVVAVPVQERPASSKKLVWAGVAVALLLGGVGVFSVIPKGKAENSTPNNPTTPTPTNVASVTPEIKEEGGVITGQPSTPQSKRVTLIAIPIAEVYRAGEGQSIGKTPYAVELSDAKEALAFVLKAEGFEDETVQIQGNDPYLSDALSVTLKQKSATIGGKPNPKTPIKTNNTTTKNPKDTTNTTATNTNNTDTTNTNTTNTNTTNTNTTNTNTTNTNTTTKPKEPTKIEDGGLADPFKKKKTTTPTTPK